MIRTLLLLIILSMPGLGAVAQDFLSVDGTRIVDASNQPVELRGIGLDGWMVKEGPYLGTSTVIPSQHEFHEFVEGLVDQSVANDFYEKWLENFVQKVDIDQASAWGYNTIRIPMHYNLFTLPIEDEPVAGENTWMETGFTLLDNVIGWCRDNQMYVILEMKAAPGGQNTNSIKSDYDAEKPSLWEDSNNVSKTLELWKRIAQRYADEPVIAGYSILNEPETSGANLLTLYRNIGLAIREVDQNHIIFMYANEFGTDFSGLATDWDNKIVATASKLQNNNDQATIQPWLDFSLQNNVPLFISNIYDNSNIWMRDAVKLLEENNVGWSFSPLKRVEGTSGTYVWTPDSRYQRLLNYVYGRASKPGPTTSGASLRSLYNGVLNENLTYFKDVNDAIFRQTETDQPIPFAPNTIPGVVFATDFDLGLPGIAYEDDTVQNVVFSTNKDTPWNNGRSYRNDGVDIEPSLDEVNSNGFLVGWNKSNEWLQYTLDITQNGVYDIDIRYASLLNVGVMYLELDGVRITENLEIPTTGSWQGWETFTIRDIVLTTTDKVLRLNVKKAAVRAGSFNLGSYNFRLTGASEDIMTSAISGESAGESGFSILVNKALIDQNLNASDFTLTINGTENPVTGASINSQNSRIIDFTSNESFFWTDNILLSYNGTGIQAVDGTDLEPFSNLGIVNNAPVINTLPARIEAEDFVSGIGVRIETTEDADGGENIGFIDAGDIIEYSIIVTEADVYNFTYRTSARTSVGSFRLDMDDNGSVTTLHQHSVPETGDWESYENSANSANLPVGEYLLRINVIEGGFNINWFEVSNITSSESPVDRQMLTAYPNPGKNYFRAQGKFSSPRNVSLIVRDMLGRRIWEKELGRTVEYNELIPTDGFPKGVYLLILQDSDGIMTSTRIIKE